MSFIDTVFGFVTLSVISFSLIVFICSIGIFFYRKVAINRGILANPNFRTLHEFPIPTGGGIVFALIFFTCVFILWIYDILSYDLLMVIGVGGLAAAIFGLLDDIYNIKAFQKLIIQISFSGWILFWIYKYTALSTLGLIQFIAIPLIILLLVWIINAYNFMDGIDGMAVSGAFYISATLTLIMLLMNGKSELAVIFFLLMASVTAFIFFNWPPASILMGDSGSIFLGYLFGSFILITIARGDLSLWTWLVIFGYFIADTTVTLIARLILVKNWYSAHRSHAYQNLARITGSHLKVTVGVIIYHIIWLLPLSLWTVLQPEMVFFAVSLSVIPAFVLAYRYGPVLSSS